MPTGPLPGTVEGVSRSLRHTTQKAAQDSIRLLAALGVDGDAHAGVTVKHRSRARFNPTLPNLRQVHLIHGELHDELRARGFDLTPGAMGENVTTRGIELLGLPAGARLRLGADAVVELTGLRNPCVQLDRLQPGLMEAVLERTPDGALIRKAGVMAIVIEGGDVRPGDPIEIALPAPPYSPLKPV